MNKKIDKDTFTLVVMLLKEYYNEVSGIEEALNNLNIYIESDSCVFKILENFVGNNFDDFMSNIILEYSYNNEEEYRVTENGEDIIINNIDDLYNFIYS